MRFSNLSTSLRLAAAICAAASLALPSLAAAQSYPSYSTASQQTIKGSVTGFNGAYTVYLQDDKGYGDNVELHDGTVINPTGIKLQEGMRVTIYGYANGSVFSAYRIDVAAPAYYGNSGYGGGYGSGGYGGYGGYGYGGYGYGYPYYGYGGYPGWGIGIGLGWGWPWWGGGYWPGYYGYPYGGYPYPVYINRGGGRFFRGGVHGGVGAPVTRGGVGAPVTHGGAGAPVTRGGIGAPVSAPRGGGGGRPPR